VEQCKFSLKKHTDHQMILVRLILITVLLLTVFI